MPAPPAARAEDDLLRESLERHLRASLGGPAALAAVARQRCAYASSYDAEVVTARLRTGEEVKVFLKNLGVSHFPKDAAGQRRDRERKVYSDLLPGAGLDTAQSYGSVWDPERGTYWLLLEYLPGTELRFCEFEHWLAAAGWLGRAQGQFAPQADRLGGCDFLVRHDASFFRSKADLALGQVAELYPPLADRLARALDGYDRLIAVMAGQPPTLVHGHYRACNIVVDAGRSPPRMCPVDWEQAAFGSALYDLAYLADGFDPPALDRLLEAYRGAALAHAGRAPSLGEIRHLVHCFRLFAVVHRLSRARERGLAERKAAKAVAAVEDLRRLAIGGEGAGG